MSSARIVQPRYIVDEDGNIVGGKDNFGDSSLDAAAGNIDGVSTVNKYGVAIAGIQTSATDIWDRADLTPTQQIWLAPTAARIHTIASTSVNDTTGGTGANSVIISYLSDWDTAETTETVTGDFVSEVF